MSNKENNKGNLDVSFIKTLVYLLKKILRIKKVI